MDGRVSAAEGGALALEAFNSLSKRQQSLYRMRKVLGPRWLQQTKAAMDPSTKVDLKTNNQQQKQNKIK